MHKKYSILALIILICIVTTLFLSVAFVISHANHHCIGEDCPICAAINNCIHFMNNLFSGFCNLTIYVFPFAVVFLCSSFTSNYFYRKGSLIILKVRLNN